MKMVFKPAGEKLYREFGTDGNEFERIEDGWAEARKAAALGLPWAGATFRLVDPGEGDHADDCSLGIGSEWCDCGIEPTIVAEETFLPPRSFSDEDIAMAGGQRALLEREAFDRSAVRVSTRVLPPAEADILGLGPLVVEAVAFEVAEPKTDGRTVVELSRLSPAKVAEPWTGRPAQLQVLSNVVHGRNVSAAQRRLIKQRMEGRPLGQLAVVVAEVLS